MTSANKAPQDADPGSLISYSADHLANQFLIAMPGMVDPNFANSVVYLFEHNERGAMGLVVNKPTEVNLATLFDKIELKLEIAPLLEQPVYFGGPVQTDRGFVLHEQGSLPHYSSSLRVPDGLAMTTSKDILEAVVAGDGPKRFLMTLGYAGWSAGQLEDEIARNGWLNVPAPTDQMGDIIFATPDEYKYEKVLALLGINPSFLSAEVGHA